MDWASGMSILLTVTMRISRAASVATRSYHVSRIDSYVGKYWYSEPMLTPARSAISRVLTSSNRRVAISSSVACRMASTVWRARCCTGRRRRCTALRWCSEGRAGVAVSIAPVCPNANGM